jgi:hypothetical protein
VVYRQYGSWTWAVMRSGGWLKQFREFLQGEIGLSYDRTKRSSIKFFVIGDHDLSKRLIPSQDHVTTMLASDVESSFSQRARAFTAGYAWKAAHTATRSASNRSGGTGRRSSASAAM